MKDVVIVFGGARGLGRHSRVSKLTAMLKSVNSSAQIRWCAFEDPTLWRGPVLAPYRATPFGSRLDLEEVVNDRTGAVLVDNYPDGPHGQLAGLLHELRDRFPRCVVVYLMRDIVDESSRVRHRLCQSGGSTLLRECFDGVVVLGRRQLFDPVEEYQLPEHLVCHFLGYLPPHEIVTASSSQRRVLVTAGGGDDAWWMPEVLTNVVESGLPFDVITGPRMPSDLLEAVQTVCAGSLTRSMWRDVPSLAPFLQNASSVLCAGGYNTVTEAVHAGANVTVIPRTHPTKEQVLRAGVFEARGLVRAAVDSPLDRLLVDAYRRATPAVLQARASSIYTSQNDVQRFWEWLESRW